MMFYTGLVNGYAYSSFTSDLSNWDVSKVKETGCMQ